VCENKIVGTKTEEVYRLRVRENKIVGTKTEEVYRLRVRENKIVGTKTEEVTWGRRKLHNEELHDLY
jgi:hypothetical protein